MWNRIWTQSIGGKIVVILLAVVVLNTAVDAFIQRDNIASSYGELEREAAIADVERAYSIVQDEIDDLSELGMHFAHRDETRRFARDEHAAFLRSDLGDWTLAKFSIDLLYICDTSGRVIWGRVEDPATHTQIQVREFPGESLSRTHAMLLPIHAEDRGRIAGLMAVSDRPMMVSTHEILDSRGMGGPAGRLIVGRFLGGDYLEELGRRAHMTFRVWPLDGEALPPEVASIRDEITGRAAGEFVYDEGEEVLKVYTSLNSVLDQPELILGTEMPRELTARGRASARFALISTLSSAFLILLVMLRLLHRIVITPLSVLTHHAVEIGRTDDTTHRIAMTRSDEIGSLADEFDAMVDKLAKSRQELVKTARRAGMSEIATGVLHNVGNVLNSVNVSARLLQRKVEEFSADDLGRVVDVLDENQDDLGQYLTEDPRGKHLLPFLRELGDSLKGQREGVMRELGELNSGVEHIADLVRSQQSYAGTKGVFEMAKLEDEVEAALKISTLASVVTEDVELIRDFEEIPSVSVDKHKLMEILVNLVQNAYQAASRTGRGPGHVTVRIRSAVEHVRFEVSDDGVGIEAENLAKIFNHGFTTKPDGHGFGLHVSANAATEMNATLTAHSDGLGRGATFVLQLPVANRDQVLAA